MSKLIGTNPNQVPSNADLGTAAFMDAKDFLLSRGSSLSAINAVIRKTALDVFVYDTAKDSDGGAWRKRTQHTSWYNEKLNTAIRGSRKDFPVVAIIITRNTDITIYDGDDPTVPMWMVFTGTQYSMISNTHNGISCATMKNGNLAVGSVSGYNHGGISVINFISDYGYLKTAGYTRDSSSGNGIVDRDKQLTGGDGTSVYILNNNVKSVAMTVLPNAPIDSNTGLPIPNIGVATDLGVSVIKEVSDAVAIYHTASTHKGAKLISFVGNMICYSSQQSGSSTNYWRRVFVEIPAGNITGAYTHNIPGVTCYDARGNNGNTPALNTNNNLGFVNNDIKAAVLDKAIGFRDKLTLLSVDDFPGVGGNPSSSDTLVSYIGNTYNTGWMNGDIRLAGLADTENFDYHEYVEGYGDFTAGSEWTRDTGWSTSGNVATKTGGTGNNYISKSIGRDFEYGKWYQAEFDLLSGNGASVLLVNRHINGEPKPYTGGASNVDVAFFEGPEANKFYAVWQQSTLNKGLISLYSGQSVSLDNLKVHEIGSEDRTRSAGDLLRTGTIANLKRTPVASGAELMAYSGFISGSVLAQPYTSNLNFGSGDYLISCWVNVNDNPSGGADYYVCRGYRGGTWTNHSFYLRQNTPTNYIEFGVTENGFSTRDIVQSPNAIPLGVWTKVTLVKKSSRLHLYLNGREVATNSVTRSHTNTQNGPLVIGDYGVGGAGGSINGSITLVKISATAPSPEQVKKMYDDEKVLFKENAKATLYGSASVLTTNALAYDDSTELLHVGTNYGRSDFQGLRRINNTTRGIGTVISAEDGFVVEE